MAVLKHNGERWLFRCPGCGSTHWFTSPRWTWNGDQEKPTISPSINVTIQAYPQL